MRIVNVGSEPFEWTYNSGIYGPVAPGEVREFADDVAAFGVKKSEQLDDLGNPTGVFRLSPVSSMSARHLEEFAQFRCSLCDKGLFRKDELKAHMMESHFAERVADKPPEKTTFEPRPFRK